MGEGNPEAATSINQIQDDRCPRVRSESSKDLRLSGQARVEPTIFPKFLVDEI